MSETHVELKGFKQLLNLLGSTRQTEVLSRSLWKSTLLLKGWIVKERLSGARPMKLDRVTGKLASSITASKPINTGRGLWAKVGTNVIYAPIHEFGFHGTVIVSAHRRNVGTFSLSTGNKVKRSKKGFTVMRFGMVRQHNRTMNMPARPFIRPAIEDQGNINNISKIFSDEIMKEFTNNAGKA